MDYMPLIVALLTGLLIPAVFNLFKDTDGDRLNKIKMLAEIQEMGLTGELGELLKAEIRQEKGRRSTANGVADLITWTLCGLFLGGSLSSHIKASLSRALCRHHGATSLPAGCSVSCS